MVRRGFFGLAVTGPLLAGGLALLGLLVGVPGASAQLLSPGKLTEAHAGLEGMRQCTQCHEARRRGVQDGLCLDCHTPLNARLEANEGYHATLDDPSCGTCHKEHAGRNADMLRFDEGSFEHETQAGFTLAGAHESADCSTCHNKDLIRDPAVRRFKAQGTALDKTFLGLGTTCVACHVSEDPHRDQFDSRGCEQCHNETEWEGAVGFDHDDARFKLEGEHRAVGCIECHAEAAPAADGLAAFVRFRPLEFARCESCHIDNHDGQMGTCSECHTPTGWSQIPRDKFETSFDHTVTDFPLEGAHLDLGCMTCHQTGVATSQIDIEYHERNRTPSYPQPVVESGCMSCHIDYHDGDVSVIATGSDCTSCHTDAAWLPSSFDLFRHNTDTEFALMGAHAAVPCSSCHEPANGIAVAQASGARVTFHVDAAECATCHLSDAPHGDQFEGRSCESCHTNNDVFKIASFDHEQTTFPLTGSHEAVECLSCHPTEPSGPGIERVVYRPLKVECAACHAELQ